MKEEECGLCSEGIQKFVVQQLYWMLLMKSNSCALRRVETSHRGEGVDAWLKLVQRCEPRTHQRAANQLEQLFEEDLSGDLDDKALLRKCMVRRRFSRKTCRVGIWNMPIRTELVR